MQALEMKTMKTLSISTGSRSVFEQVDAMTQGDLATRIYWTQEVENGQAHGGSLEDVWFNKVDHVKKGLVARTRNEEREWGTSNVGRYTRNEAKQ